MTPRFSLRRLDAGDAASYRLLRLEGLRSHPEAFGASWEIEAAQPLAWFAERLARNIVFGAWSESGELAGILGLRTHDAPKSRHKADLWGMFVLPRARGTGLSAVLVDHVIAHAPPGVEELRLSVVATNLAAVRLYARAGFAAFGREPRALKVGERYCDELLMALRLPRPET
jgi:RimJ/RimL family protein N-acetyltransferase